MPTPTEMKDRIKQIMEQRGMNQKEFSLATEINQATLSGIFNGRTSPTLNHAELLHRHFPNLSMKWLMFGEGDMYEQSEAEDAVAPTLPFEETPKVEPQGAQSVVNPAPVGQQTSVGVASAPRAMGEVPMGSYPHGAFQTLPKDVDPMVKYIDKPQRKIVEIRIFFDDGTFEVFGK